MAAESRQVLASHARTFNLASVFLPRDQRDDAAIVYAFCRTVDDLVDEARHPEEGERDIGHLAEMLRGERPASPLAEAFLEVAERRGFPLQAAHDLMQGVLSDVGEVTLVDDRDLIQYGYAVAGTVGLMMCGVIGVREPWALAHAIDLGVAMQITNISRDVVEDAGRGRIYIPTRRLVAAGIDPEQVRVGDIDGEAFAPVLRDVLELAERYYASGDEGMRAIPWRPRLAIQSASRVYRAIGLVLRDRAYDVTQGRAVVPGAAKVSWVLRAVVRASLCGLSARKAHDPALHTALRGRPGTDALAPPMGTRVKALAR
nr:phytoene synthase CrtB [uncultured bacterium HF186_25m_30B18]